MNVGSEQDLNYRERSTVTLPAIAQGNGTALCNITEDLTHRVLGKVASESSSESN
jgi:hypothetical protein